MVGAAAACTVLVAIAALGPSVPPSARAQTAPDVRLREPPSSRPPGAASTAARLTLRISSATLDEDSRTLADGADVTLLAQPTYVALPSAGPNLLRISPAITITARDASGRDMTLSPTAQLTFTQPDADGASVHRLDGGAWRPIQATTRGRALVVHPVNPGTYALFAELPPDWPWRHDVLIVVALNTARLVVDDLAARS